MHHISLAVKSVQVWIHLVWVPLLTLQNTAWIPLTNCLWYYRSFIKLCSGSGCLLGQRASDESTCQQTCEHLLLSSSAALPTAKFCVSGRNEASSNCARPSAHRQLQLCTCQHYSVYNHTATARSEYRSPSRPRSETQSSYHTSVKETPLAACSPTY